jgi:pyruvate carboxylase subunit A
MCAKVIVWGRTWPEAVARGQRALNDMFIDGVRTTIPFYQEILNHPEFRTGCFHTGFLQAHPELVNYSRKRSRDETALAVAAAIAAHVGL